VRLPLLLTAILLLSPSPPAQEITRPGLTPAFTPRESAPAFVVECRNTSASAVPWPTIQTIRLDGSDLELAGRIVSSQLGTPGERFEVAPGATHRLLFVLSAGTDKTASSPSQGLDARVRQAWALPLLAPGRHHLAVECLGSWSDEGTFVWSPDTPLDR
jgi:hypothetical protein